jgi:hypothetical protein
VIANNQMRMIQIYLIRDRIDNQELSIRELLIQNQNLVFRRNLKEEEVKVPMMMKTMNETKKLSIK